MAGRIPRRVGGDGTVASPDATEQATKRLAPRRDRPRRGGPAGGARTPVHEAPPVVGGEVGADPTLVAFLQGRVEQLAEELAEARTEMRGIRYEADSLRVDAGRAAVFAALVEAERARVAEIRAERDGLADELAHARRPWPWRLVGAMLAARPRAPRHRPS